jgi:TolA-binding protein
MRRFFAVGMILLALFISGCSGNKAAELYDTAQFEEKQSNKEHAAKLYEEILKKYPDSEFAKKAGERLSQIKGDLKTPSNK